MSKEKLTSSEFPFIAIRRLYRPDPQRQLRAVQILLHAHLERLKVDPEYEKEAEVEPADNAILADKIRRRQ